MTFLSYLKTVADKPAETYVERKIAELRNELIEHPEDELHLKQQILIMSHIEDNEDVVIDLANELMEMDVEKIYACDCNLILGRMYAKKKETTLAIDYYHKAVAANPEHDQAIIELAELYEDKFDYDSAIAVYDLLDQPYFADIKDDMYRYKGVCYYKKREFEKSLECFQNSLEIDTNDSAGTLTDNIGGCYFNMNKFPEAFSWFRKSLENKPQSATAHYGLGLCFQHTKDSFMALHHYFEAIKIKPDYAEAYNNIAAVTVNLENDYKTGVEMLNKALETCKDNNLLTMIYLNLTHIYSKLQEFALADHYKALYMKCWGFDFIIEEDDDDD